MPSLHRPAVRGPARPLGLVRALAATLPLALAAPGDPVRADSDVPPPNTRVAFLGDQGSGTGGIAVLQLIASEGADAVVHAGDFDYADDPASWNARIDSILGSDFPYFALSGNHDDASFYGGGGYQELIAARMNRLGIPWSGDLGAQSAHAHMGILYVFTTPDVFGAGDGYHDAYIRETLAADDHVWRISSWHKNMHLMQVGGKRDETGWGVYEESRRGGAIVATGHEHSYSRSHEMSDADTQQFDADAHPIVLRRDDPLTPADEGTNVVVVAGLGGKSVRDQEILPTPPWWGSVYASNQGATHGALFGVFNYEGNPRRAYFYFKDIDGVIVDEFELYSTLGTVCETGDDDGDDVCNAADNCRLAANPDQTDSDQDGYGNACDPDYDNDGAVGALDLNLLRPAVGARIGEPEYAAVADSDADGAVGARDANFFFRAFGGSPGPSGLACAGLAPCLAHPCGEAADGDGDGVCDPVDNCSLSANASQIDADLDGFGNACDADYDNNGLVGSRDWNAIRPALGSAAGEPGYDPATDVNGDDAVGAVDLNYFREAFQHPPGPSGLYCAGTVPCRAP